MKTNTIPGTPLAKVVKMKPKVVETNPFDLTPLRTTQADALLTIAIAHIEAAWGSGYMGNKDLEWLEGVNNALTALKTISRP